jgi:hypothetical protein
LAQTESNVQILWKGSVNGFSQVRISTYDSGNIFRSKHSQDYYVEAKQSGKWRVLTQVDTITPLGYLLVKLCRKLERHQEVEPLLTLYLAA